MEHERGGCVFTCGWCACLTGGVYGAGKERRYAIEKVTLYVPCYNAERYLIGCLESVLKQSYPIEEIVVIDDGSGDGTAKLAVRYSVSLLRHERNQGLAAARNTALKHARSPFIASVDADCTLASDWLERLMQAVCRDKVAGAGGKLIEVSADGIANQWRAAHMRQHWGEAPLANPPFLFGSNTVFRKDALVAAGGYDARYRTNGEDREICVRLARSGCTLVYEPGALVRHWRYDTVRSLLSTHWQWSFFGVEGRRPPETAMNLLCRCYDGAAALASQAGEDIHRARFDLLALDGAVFLHHRVRDLLHYARSRARRP